MPRHPLRAATAALALLATPLPSLAAAPAAQPGVSPATCAAGDEREPGIQGEVPAGATPHYACGVRLVGQLPLAGNVAGTGTCVYVRSRGTAGTPDEAAISVVDVRDATHPKVIGAPIPVHNGSESLRLVVTASRAVMVSGSTVLDIADCLHPKVLGEIRWPDTTVPGVARKNLPHDIRLNHAGTRVFGSFGVWEVNLDNLADPASWKIVDHRCEIAAQLPGAWQEIHRQSLAARRSLCDDATRPAPRGANYAMGGSPLQASLLWPQVSHSPDFNADDTRLYVGDQSGGNMALWSPVPRLHVIDITQSPYRVIGTLDGPGHGLDWFRSNGREYLLHSNEGGTAGIMGQPERGDPCKPWPRPASLGWAFEAFISDVTDPAHPTHTAMLPLAINSPQFCAQRKASGRDPWLAYHLLDRTENPRFAALNFGDAGLRIFDIRDPAHPVEAAYFNHGVPVHAQVGYYDAARRLLFFSDTGGLKVLAFEPQVRKQLGL
ncbi:MAG: hypothetical protein KGN34_00300 [Sphingomonadales bacterium]|nr:hypothetical protein [Sphingomonadales bacterium]